MVFYHIFTFGDGRPVFSSEAFILGFFVEVLVASFSDFVLALRFVFAIVDIQQY